MANQFAHGEDSITQASVETLMKRGLKPASDGKFTWSSDLRLRVPAAFSALEEQVLHYASRIRCPMLLLKVFSNFTRLNVLSHNPYLKKEVFLDSSGASR